MSSINPKNKIFSEYQHGRNRSAHDMMIGVNQGVEGLDQVDKRANRHGVECKYDCSHCGWQTVTLTSWGELARYFRGIPVKGTTPTHQGMLVRLRCARCRRVTKQLWSWPEVKQHVEEAVRFGRLPPNVLHFSPAPG